MAYITTLLIIISPLLLFLGLGGYVVEKYPALFDKIINYMED